MSPKAEFANVRFKVCESENGTPYLGTLENGPKENAVLNETTNLTLHLKKGTTPQEARAVAEYINTHVVRVGLQSLP